MSFATDWSLNYSTKKISYIGSGTRWLVQDFYSELMDLFDDAAQMDDPVPMSAQTPREFTLINGWSMNADSDFGYLYGGAIVDGTNNDIWACFYSIGSLASGAVVYVEQNGSLVSASPGYTDGHIDMLVKVVDNGVAVDNKYVTAYTRDLGSTYDHFSAQATATGGYNPIPLANEDDANDNSGGSGYTGITITFGTASKDLGDGDGANDYDVVIDGNSYTAAQVYEYLKYVTRRENTSAVGTGDSTEGRFYQAADAAYNPIKKAPFGSFAGGKFFGARGVWLEGISDSNNIELIDAAGDTHTPPNSITVSVTGLEAGDRALIALDDGTGAIEKDTYTISSVTSSTIVANTAIASDTPASGTIRVGDTRYEYDSWSGSTFTMSAGNDPTGETGDFYVPLIDDVATGTSLVSGTIIYSADRDIIARVRKYGILPFENTGTVTSAGLAVSAIRTDDGIVTP